MIRGNRDIPGYLDVVGIVVNKNILKNISDQEMDRKDFLKYSGLVLLSVVGLKALATILFTPEQTKVVVQTKETRRGFGGGKYGV